VPHIALATYRRGPEDPEDRDLPVLLPALDAAGARAEAVHWDDPEVDWASFDLVLIRSTWDYTLRVAEFTAWAERCARLTRLANPAPVVRWNTDKRYLGELAAAGVPTVPTRYLAPGDPVELPEDREYVIKPTSGAGSRYAARYTPEARERAVRHLERMHAEGLTAMVQPYLKAIDVTGERPLLFLDGEFVHANRKGAVLTPGTPYDARKVAHPGLEGWEPTEAELAVARAALAAVPGDHALLYARVDLVDGDEGEPRVMELELVEPNLFLWLHPDSMPVVTERILRAAAGA
jgi:glutathione synthase/RimK-type ligase-like ATP-grasp enzyme